MDPKISSLQKYIGFFTSSSAGNQGSEVPKPYKNQASTAFCTGLKASIFVVEIGTGIYTKYYQIQLLELVANNPYCKLP